MSFDQMYDEMLHDEFRSSGKHQAKAPAMEAEPVPLLVESPSRGRHAATDPTAAVAEVEVEAQERPRGFQRYRTAALVGAGGMACAAAGAFLGGLGGYFTISPAAAHPLASPTVTQDLPLAQAINNAVHSSSPSATNGTAALESALFSNTSGGLTQGIAPFATLTSEPLQNLAVTGLPGLGGGSTGGGTVVTSGAIDNPGAGGNGGGGTTNGSPGSDLGLSNIVASITGVLGNLGSALGGGGGVGSLSGLVPTLDGVLTDVTGTLGNLNSLLPIASLPLPTGGGTTVLAGLTGPVTGAPATTGGSSSSNPVTSALAPVLNAVGAVAGAVTGGSTPSLPSLPLNSGSGSGLPSLPLTTSSGSTASAPTVDTPTVSSTSNGSTTINVPLPSLPVSVPTISIGGLSVGISNSTDSGSSSGLTLTLP